MKIIDIVGDNYLGKWNKTRTACRGIVIENSEILLSYESVTGQWMIPGGRIRRKRKRNGLLHSRSCGRNRNFGKRF